MINDITLAGRVGKKDVRTIKGDKEMATIYLATYQRWTDKAGERQEKTTWHNVNFFDKLADFVGKYIQVGSMVYIKGVVNHKPIEEGERKGQWTYSVTAKEVIPFPVARPPKSELSQGEPAKAATPSKKYGGSYDDFTDLNDQIPF
jgi:single-strand DNA-binding protein